MTSWLPFYIIRNLTQRVSEVKKEIYVCDAPEDSEEVLLHDGKYTCPAEFPSMPPERNSRITVLDCDGYVRLSEGGERQFVLRVHNHAAAAAAAARTRPEDGSDVSREPLVAEALLEAALESASQGAKRKKRRKRGKKKKTRPLTPSPTLSLGADDSPAADLADLADLIGVDDDDAGEGGRAGGGGGVLDYRSIRVPEDQLAYFESDAHWCRGSAAGMSEAMLGLADLAGLRLQEAGNADFEAEFAALMPVIEGGEELDRLDEEKKDEDRKLLFHMIASAEEEEGEEEDGDGDDDDVSDASRDEPEEMK